MGHAMAVWCLDVEFQALFLRVALKEKYQVPEKLQYLFTLL